ncbi:MAG: polysaccharide deacetylase family protein [Dysgonamonadaceae bacterium]|jgi:hypothetical protein|nr:polysaccharide deacetylase family protein [Dysgonamonadaceae bacterium]
MIFIYSSFLNSRLEYVAEHLFKNILGVDFILSDDKKVFLDYPGPGINYSTENLNHGIHIFPHGLLEETGLNFYLNTNKYSWEGLFCFFAAEKGNVPFDIFSASFYLLASYEEYGVAESDLHGRFPPEESMAYKNGFLDIPIIDRWAYKLKDLLIETFGEEQSYHLRSYRFVSTFDIDYPYLYRNKGLLKNTAGILRDLSKGKFTEITGRLKVLLHLEEDPYMKALRWLDDFHQKHGKNYYLFSLISGYGKYGRKTIYPQRKYYRYLRSLEQVEIGLHASYDSFLDKKRTGKEKRKLEKRLGKKIYLNRRHYLRVRLPETYRILNELEFREDFSFAYAKFPGFRSGTAVPYFFYDLDRDIRTGLLIRPTVVMDSCLMTHQGLKPEDSLSKLKQLADECKKSGGDFVMLWHNNHLTGNREKNPWVNVFIQSFEYAFSLENGNFGVRKK